MKRHLFPLATSRAQLRQREVLSYLRRQPQPVPFAAIRRYVLEHSPAGDLNRSYFERTFQRDLPLIAKTTDYTIRCGATRATTRPNIRSCCPGSSGSSMPWRSPIFSSYRWCWGSPRRAGHWV